MLFSCSLKTNKEIVKTFLKNNDKTIQKEEFKEVTLGEITLNETKKEETTLSEPKKIIKNNPIYFIGEPYYIEGVEYIPQEDYSYNETGLASYYGSYLHRKKTINNEFNKVTELLARHKTLPLPSVVKITNLDNGLSVIVRVNDRGPKNNGKIIEVSRKVSQLLRFYKQKITRVRVEILADPSKQLKIVTLSMNNPDFNKTLKAVPTEEVTITDLDNSTEEESNINSIYEQPIEIGFEKVSKTELFVKISGFNSYKDAQTLSSLLKESYKVTYQKDNTGYSIIYGPLLNQEADNLFQILVSKGYKHSEIIIK